MNPILASLVLTLQWCDPHELFQQGWTRIGTELNRIVQPLDMAADLTRGAGNIQVVLVKTEPSAWGLPPEALGAVMSRSRPQTKIYVFFSTVARMLGYRPEALRRRWPSAREERDLSRAFARVIFHELVHAVLPSRPHAEGGLTGRKVDRAALVASRIEVDRFVADEFRAALDEQLRDRSAPSSN
jgi:hypothetical protein